MKSVKNIKKYIKCPMKYYITTNSMSSKIENDNKSLRYLLADLNDLLQRNLRGIKNEMSLEEIEEKLIKNEESFIEDYEGSVENIEEIKKDFHYNVKILALKVKKAMELQGKNGNQIADLFFPTSMYNYLIRDLQLEIIGACDKIEIIEGRYYPVKMSPSKPPKNGVWDIDAIELIAHALLIEQEFDTEVFVGFVDYLKLGERRPVVMDAQLRKRLFKVLHEMDSILGGNIPAKINTNENECRKCVFKEECKEIGEVEEY